MKWDKNADLDMSNVDDVRGQSGGGFQMPSGGGFRLPKSGGMLGILLMVVVVFILPKLVGGGGGFNIDASGLPGSAPSALDSAIEDALQNAPLDSGETPDDEQARCGVGLQRRSDRVGKEFASANKPYEDARMRLHRGNADGMRHGLGSDGSV